MPEWLAIVLTVLLAAFAVWLVFTVIFGWFSGDIIEGAGIAAGVVVSLVFITGLFFGFVALGNLIWSGVP